MLQLGQVLKTVLSERGQSYQVTYCMITLTESARNGQIQGKEYRQVIKMPLQLTWPTGVWGELRMTLTGLGVMEVSWNYNSSDGCEILSNLRANGLMKQKLTCSQEAGSHPQVL